MSDDPQEKKCDEANHDIVLVHGRTEDGAGLRAIRSQPGSLALAELRPVREGAPLSPSSELVRLHVREGSPILWDVEVQYRSGETMTSHGGPARVCSDEYRQNWDQIFGQRNRRRDEPVN